ncbi:hypothetical protein KQ51_00195 [Candidatus Izimaplasma bacterium HR1]|jgi:hypothetical protein|uniref:hypothetical protein n=1 Tax=Candidatus Izimoplasma sp. HR1 TaxID=1541959 RepID=UPI0004F77F90|nr:hypothetical protein KQ51_00195 [Candidatus Izimaplasma bacterium HR1]
MFDLEYENSILEEKVRIKTIKDEINVLIKVDVLKSKVVDSIDGYEPIGKVEDAFLKYSLYYNSEKMTYANIKQGSSKTYRIYELDYSNPELVKKAVSNAFKLRTVSEEDNEGSFGYTVIGYVVLILGIVCLIAAGSGGAIFIIPALLISALYFGISRIIKEINNIKNKLS